MKRLAAYSLAALAVGVTHCAAVCKAADAAFKVADAVIVQPDKTAGKEQNARAASAHRRPVHRRRTHVCDSSKYAMASI